MPVDSAPRVKQAKPQPAVKVLGEESTSYPDLGIGFVTKHTLMDGKPFDMIGVKPGDTSSVLAVTTEGKIILQYVDSPAVGKRLLMLPTSRIDDGAGSDSARLAGSDALRGIGYRVSAMGSVEEMGTVFASPGYSMERVHTLIAKGASHVGAASNAIEATPEEAIGMILTGEIRDSNTIQAILRYAVFDVGLEKLKLSAKEAADHLHFLGNQNGIDKEPVTIRAASEEQLKRFGSFLSIYKVWANDSAKGQIGVVKKGDATVTVPIDEQGRIVFVKIERPIAGKPFIELPAGIRDRKENGELETPEQNGLRELEEETGEKGGDAILLTSSYPSSRYSTEILHTVLARATSGGKVHDELGEVITDRPRKTFQEALTMIRAGELEDGKSVQGVLLYALVKELEKRAAEGQPTR